jgi:multidrug resistance efflux pump
VLSFAFLFLPVNLTVLAPAELVPFNPSVIRAPLDGVIDSVSVAPNQKVSKNDILFKFDRISIKNRLQISQRELDTVKAEYRQKAQLALMDRDSKSSLVLLQSQINEKTTEIAFLLQLDERSAVLSPQEGIVLFDDPVEWIGRPVVTGERVMMVANEKAIEIEGWLSPADAIELDDGAHVRLYLNAAPLKSLTGSLRYIAHEATARPDGRYAYRIRATLLDNGEQSRVGLRGTIRLEGEEVTLAYWVFRRPFAAVRAWLGI